jgi:anti-sigma regulatory factor (Ser/Thr protein kinase)
VEAAPGQPRLGLWTFAATVDRLSWLREQLRETLAGTSVDQGAVALAVTEAVANVVRHAYVDGEGEVMVAVERAGAEIIVAVRDQGVGVEGFRLGKPEGGLGLSLIRALADHVRLEPTTSGTLVVMRFAARDPADQEDAR